MIAAIIINIMILPSASVPREEKLMIEEK